MLLIYSYSIELYTQFDNTAFYYIDFEKLPLNCDIANLFTS